MAEIQDNPFLVAYDNWNELKDIDFNDMSINGYHIDTRDFCCTISNDPNKDAEKQFNMPTLRKYGKRFFHSGDEVKAIVTKFYEQSGGEGDWRMLILKGYGEPYSSSWQLKYLRVYRVKEGLIICNKDGYVLNSEVLDSDVNTVETRVTKSKKKENENI